MTNSEMVKEFMVTFGQKVPKQPWMPNQKLFDLRWDLMAEEMSELLAAYKSKDIIEISDSLADILYVVYGAAHAFGIPIDEVFEEVHKSNMSKLGSNGEPIFRGDGKVLKGPGWYPPKINEILNKYS